MAEALKERLSVEAKLVPGAGGVFDVSKNGELVFSKQQKGRFPEHGEIIDALAGTMSD